MLFNRTSNCYVGSHLLTPALDFRKHTPLPFVKISYLSPTMNNRTRHLIQGVRKFSPLLQAFEAGHSIDEIRTAVFEALEPEFQNPTILTRYGIDLLTVEATNINQIKLHPDAHDLYKTCMQIRMSFLKRDPDRCAKVCSDWEQEIGAGLHLYWNTARFEVNKDDLPLDEFAFEVFRNIGSLLEATMLPYLRELLHHCLEGAGNCQTKYSVAALDFGKVVSRLESLEFGTQLLRPKPLNISLNQWRNIAQHFSTSTDETIITCKYGQGGKHSATFTRQELWDALVYLVSMHRAIRTAHTIFFLDQGDVLALHCKGYERKDSDIQFQFVVGAASQGFEVVSFDVTPEQSTAHFKDVTSGEPTPRGIHASQFVLELWRATKSKTVQITYSTREGAIHLWARASERDCQLVASGERDMKYLAEVVELCVAKQIEA